MYVVRGNGCDVDWLLRGRGNSRWFGKCGVGGIVYRPPTVVWRLATLAAPFVRIIHLNSATVGIIGKQFQAQSVLQSTFLRLLLAIDE